jgi:hypothetical protein
MSITPGYIHSYCRIRSRTISGPEGVLFEAKTANSLEDFLEQAYTWLQPGYPKFYKMDRLAKLGFLAAEVLLKGRNLAGEAGPEAVALVLSNAHASLDTDVRYFESTRSMASPALFVYTLANIVSGEICIRHGFKGENAFFIAGAFDPGLLSTYTNMVLAQPATRYCLAGWIDVMDDHHDVFLYLAEKTKGPGALEHSEKQLSELYLR